MDRTAFRQPVHAGTTLERGSMARPLTRKDKQGQLYTRPPNIESEIDSASSLTITELRAKLASTEKSSPGYLQSEVLVSLVREACRAGNQVLISAVLPVLLSRCEARLRVRVQESAFRDAATVREEALGSFAEMFAADGQGDDSDELDFFECRFNMAFLAFQIDHIRRELDRESATELIHDEVDAESEQSTDDEFASVAAAYHTPATQEDARFREELAEAIDALPREEREAFTLVHLLGYQEESGDPNKVTAATLCGCTGRTIRNRVKSARAKLARFKDT